MTKFFPTVMLVFLIAFPLPSFACLGPMSESVTFLAALPKHADSRPVVAEVEIVATAIADDRMRRVSRVKVVTPVKGVTAGQEFDVVSETHSCARDIDVKAGERYFIAGDLTKNVFSGVWRNPGVEE